MFIGGAGYVWTAAGNPDRAWKARSTNIDWFLVNSIRQDPVAVLAALENDRATGDGRLCSWKGSTGRGISCTPVDVQSPFPMSISTVKSSRRCVRRVTITSSLLLWPPRARRASTLHPGVLIIPADRRIIYEPRYPFVARLSIRIDWLLCKIARGTISRLARVTLVLAESRITFQAGETSTRREASECGLPMQMHRCCTLITLTTLVTRSLLMQLTFPVFVDLR